jgi:hypothetical protein
MGPEEGAFVFAVAVAAVADGGYNGLEEGVCRGLL